MTRTDHLLWILAEECCEVAQRCSKAARFSLNEIQPGQSTPADNASRIIQEFADATAAYEMLIGSGAIVAPLDYQFRLMVQTKKERVEKFLLHSRDNGRLEL